MMAEHGVAEQERVVDSAEAKILAAEEAVAGRREISPPTSELSTGKMNAPAPGWNKRQYFFNKRTRTLDTPQHTNVPELDSALRHILQAVTLFAKENMHAISGLDIDLPSEMALLNYLSSTSFRIKDSELAGNFLVHEEPRFIRITGLLVRQQLVDDNLIGHELMSMLFRRFAQLDVQAETKYPNLSWRHPMEPEFSTLVLSDSDFIHTVSIQKYLSIC